jgi:hypothetical protein
MLIIKYSIMDIEQIRKRIAELEKEEAEIKVAKDAIKEQLENDLEFVQAREEAKTVNLKKKQVRDLILNSPENQKYSAQIKSTTEDLKVLREILSAELMDFYQKSNKEEFVDEAGKVRKFKVMAKLLPKNGQHEDRDSYGKYSKEDK